MSNVKDQKSFEVKINELEQVWDRGEGRVTKVLRHKRHNDEVIAVSPLIAVYIAIESVRKDIKDLDMLEVKVDGCPFPG